MAQAGLWLLAGVLLGSVTGAATATFIAPQPPAAPQESTAEFAGRVAESLELAVTRAADRARAEASAAWPAESGETGDGAATVHADPAPVSPRTRRRAAAEATSPAVETVEPDADHLVRDASTPLAAKDAGRVAQLVVRTREAEAARRREWMFLGERAVASSLGVPDHVEQDNGLEKWFYEISYVDSSGNEDTCNVSLTFARGRVVEIDGGSDFSDDR